METFQLCPKSFGFCVKTFRQCCQNCILRVQANISVTFYGKISAVNSMSDYKLKNLGAPVKSLGWLSKLCFVHPEKHFDEFFRKILCFSSFRGREQKMLGTLVETFDAVLSKLHTTCPDEQFRLFDKNNQMSCFTFHFSIH